MRFVLIHGGFHGAWCWIRLIPELKRLGHEAVAIDLPGHGTRRDERSKIADRCTAILDVLEQGDVLVGHSAGGFDITCAANAARDRIGHLVYLAAGLPREGHTVRDLTAGTRAALAGADVKVATLLPDETGMPRFTRIDAQGRIEPFDREAVRDFFYHDCDDETADWAFSQLTPAPTECLLEPISVPEFWETNLPRSFIYCLQDRSMPYAMSKDVIERLGVIPLRINSSHSPFLSRPAELAGLLIYATLTSPQRLPRPV